MITRYQALDDQQIDLIRSQIARYNWDKQVKVYTLKERLQVALIPFEDWDVYAIRNHRDWWWITTSKGLDFLRTSLAEKEFGWIKPSDITEGSESDQLMSFEERRYMIVEHQLILNLPPGWESTAYTRGDPPLESRGKLVRQNGSADYCFDIWWAVRYDISRFFNKKKELGDGLTRFYDSKGGPYRVTQDGETKLVYPNDFRYFVTRDTAKGLGLDLSDPQNPEFADGLARELADSLTFEYLERYSPDLARHRTITKDYRVDLWESTPEKMANTPNLRHHRPE